MNNTNIDRITRDAILMLLDKLIESGLPEMGGELNYQGKHYKFELKEL